MTFPGLTVRDNLRVGAHSLRGQGTRARSALDEAIDRFPELADPARPAGRHPVGG